jgi:signal transduction histidine kinase
MFSFHKVRKQLILFNSILMGILLFLFAITTFAWAAWTVYCGEREDLLAYAKEEVVEEEEEVEEEGEDDNDGLMFNYFFDNQGNLIHYSKPGSELSRIVDEKIKHWEIGSGKPRLIFSSRNNQIFVILLVAQPIKSATGVHGMFYAGKDVTPHYHFLKKLLYILSGLLIMFIILITWIGYIMARRAMGPIEHSYQRQREFLADASHELRLPLSVLLSSVEATQMDEENRFSRFTRQVLSDMKDEIKKMSKIIGDLLTLARSDTDVLNLMKERFAIKPIAEQTIRKLYPIAQKKDIDLKLDIMEDIVIYADKERISQLLLILLDNALKYTPKGGEVQLFIQSSGMGSPELKIIVKDNGIGIAPQEQEHIFERFYRVDKTRSRQMGGTGLGLPIAKWIIESHGGSIKVVSQLGQGSSFLITLPQ